MRRVLLTGADGFVGAHFLDYLLRNTETDIVCLVRRSSTRRIGQILTRPDWARVHIYHHDLTRPIGDRLNNLLGNVDTVFSVASSADIAGSISDPASVFLNNVQMVANLAEWARTRELDAFVHLSSEEVYGPAFDGPHPEWDAIRPSTHYSASKAAQEAYLTASWRNHNLPLVILNAMNQIGPMQDPTKLVPTIIRKTLTGESVPLLVDWYEEQSGSGAESLRQYMHPRVTASAALHVAKDPDRHWNPKSKFPPRYNVSGQIIGNVALAGMVANAMGKPLNWKPVPATAARPGHERTFALDDTKLRTSGWVPPSTLEQDIHDTVTWTLEHPEWL